MRPAEVYRTARLKCAGTLFTILSVLILSVPGIGQPRISGPFKRSTAAPATKAPRASSALKKGRRDLLEQEIVAERIVVDKFDSLQTSAIMADQESRGQYKTARELFRESGVKKKSERPNRQNLPENPDAMPYSQYPYPTKSNMLSLPEIAPSAPQTVGVTFDGATGPTETGAFPPDTMGAVGPSQVVVFLNGRLRSFNKATGAADGVLNVDTDVFFSSVMTPPAAGEVVFTTDPNVRYDRLSGRWFLNMIDVPLNSTTGATTKANRILIAVSNSSTITPSTTWSFYQFLGDAALFTDYQSFGVDASAIYIGANMFTLAGSFNSTKGYVIPKAPAVAGAALTVWAFPGLVATSTGAGPFSPRGVDNPDPGNTGPTATGYFIGVDNATWNTLMIRRVTDPGNTSVAPTISANISVTTPLTTRYPVLVPHLGNTGGSNGRLDGLDDRLYAATIRNGRLWTAHNVGVNNTGVSGASNNRNAARWYELQNLSTTPSVVQSGTLFDNNATNDANQRNYWIPSIMVSGQGHVALGCSIAGTNERANAFTTGRLVGDTLGTLRNGPGGAGLPGYTNTTFSYNPPGDPGGPSRRWGDYSFTSLDPLDDMTMWTIQQYTNGTNTYGVRVAQLIAPPPAAPDAVSVAAGVPSVNVNITGTSTSGSGFFDPGPNIGGTAVNFNHISASVSGSGVVVNSVTYVSPTQITLNLNTIGAAAGVRTLTVTNPDGQQQTGSLTVLAPTAAPADLTGRILTSAGRGISSVSVTAMGPDGSVRRAYTNGFGYYRFEDLPTGVSYVIVPSAKRYIFSPESVVHNHMEQFGALNFSGVLR